MSRKASEPVTGLRNPVSAVPVPENRDAIPADVMDELNAKRPKAQKGETVRYQSRYRNFMVTREIQDDTVIGRQTVRGKNRHVVFQNYQFTTSDPDTVAWIESQDFFGLGRTVWRETDKVALDLAIDAKRAIHSLRQFVGDTDALRQHLAAEDFDALMAVSERLDAQKSALTP